jgi:pilus assembly protein Flp/PilA
MTHNQTDPNGGQCTLTEVVRWLVERRPVHGEEGQGLAEYALILALIAIVAILSLIFLGDTIGDMMSFIGSTVAESTD